MNCECLLGAVASCRIRSETVMEADFMQSDETAYRCYIGGDESAADILVEKYADALTLYINGYVRNIHDSEELMIEAFARLFAKERQISGDCSFKAYLYKTARNLALRYGQKRKLHFLCIEELPFEPQSAAEIETDILRRERDRKLYEALEKLKAEYREAIYLVYLEGMSYRSAAAVMKKSERQVSKLLYHGKQTLKKILAVEDTGYAAK